MNIRPVSGSRKRARFNHEGPNLKEAPFRLTRVLRGERVGPNRWPSMSDLRIFTWSVWQDSNK